MKRADLKREVFVAALAAAVCLAVVRHSRADLVAYWDFEEGTGTTATDSVSGNVGTLTNGAAFSTNVPTVGGSHSVVLDGTNDLVNVPDSASVSPTGSITLSAWVNVASVATTGNILAKESNSAYRWRYNSGTGELWALLNDGAGSPAYELFSSGVNLPTGGWHHTALTVNFDSGEVRFYLDGALGSTKTMTQTTSIQDVGGSLTIGAYSASGAEAFNGNLDEVAIWSQALSDDQVKAMANGITSPLNAAWRIDGVTYDYTGSILPYPTPTRNDDGRTKLTDAVLGTTSLDDGTWAAFADPSGLHQDNGQPQPQIDFDLGSPEMLDAVRIDYSVARTSGVYEPSSVVVEIYADSGHTSLLETYTATGFSSVDGIHSLTMNLGDEHAQYVRMKVYNVDQWTWLGEVTFFASIPEPGTAVLLSLGGVGLVGCGWRRRRRNRRP